jgi:hypothetical protein
MCRQAYRGTVAGTTKGQSLSTRETTTPKNQSLNGGYFRSSLAALLALSAPEPPPFYSPLVLLVDLPLEPLFEVSPDFSRYFLPSLAILSIMRSDHVPSFEVLCYWCSYPIESVSNPVAQKAPKPRSGACPSFSPSCRVVVLVEVDGAAGLGHAVVLRRVVVGDAIALCPGVDVFVQAEGRWRRDPAVQVRVLSAF